MTDQELKTYCKQALEGADILRLTARLETDHQVSRELLGSALAIAQVCKVLAQLLRDRVNQATLFPSKN